MKFIEKEKIEFPEKIFLFASYEERSVCVAKDLAKRGYQGDYCVFFCEDLPKPQIEKNINTIKDVAKGNVRRIPVSFESAIPMIRAITKENWPNSIMIDISCFNLGNLFPFLWSSKLGRDRLIDVTFAYSSTSGYGEWLSRDYNTPNNIIGFAGGLNFVKNRLLICAIGYEAERVLHVISAVEPSEVFLLLGVEPNKEEFYERNRQAVEEVLGSNDYKIVEVNVSDPNACMRDLADIMKNVTSGTSINLASFSTKLSCLSIWSLWLQNPKIRIWNAQPKTYNLLNYSKGFTTPRYFAVEW